MKERLTEAQATESVLDGSTPIQKTPILKFFSMCAGAVPLQDENPIEKRIKGASSSKHIETLLKEMSEDDIIDSQQS